MTTETSTPNKTHLLQWARALESGDYAQGKDRLKSESDEYCCLGVACDLAKEDIGGKWVAHDGANYFVTPDIEETVEGETAYLPAYVAEWLGLEVGGSILDPSLDGLDATTRNDMVEQSFADIAAAIRREFDLPTKEQDEHRLAWIEALESGDYAQTNGALKARHKAAYCCLGVVCKLAEADGVGKWGVSAMGDPAFVTPNDDRRTGVLPTAVSEWLGVKDDSDEYAFDPRLDGRTATSRNDQDGQTFAEIAAAARIEFGYPPKA